MGVDLPRLPQGQGQLGSVFPLEVGEGPHVVDVGVAAQDPHGGEAQAQEGVFQVLPLLMGAGIQEDAVFLVHLVEGDVLPVDEDPGVAFDVFDFHGLSPLWFPPRCKIRRI